MLKRTRLDSANGRADRIREILACPECHGRLTEDLQCPSCGPVGKQLGRQLNFGGFAPTELRRDPLNRIKETVKQRFGRLYPTAIATVSPVLSRGLVRPFLRSFDLSRELVADLGSGTHRRANELICIDGGAYHEVDIVGDLRKLPLADGALSGIVSVAVLEHVPDPRAHIAEMYRVLAPGGRLLCFVPFMQPFHASPDDYQRYTDVGLREQFARFEVISVRVGAGPTSAMLWVVQEWLAMAFSLNSERLYRVIQPMTWLLSPLKLADVVLARHPSARVLASGFAIEARKPEA